MFKQLLYAAGAFATLVSALGLLVHFEYRPALIIEVKAAEINLQQQILDVAKNNLQTQSMVLNDRLVSTEQLIAIKVNQMEEYRSKGEQPPEWIINEWVRLEAAKRDIMDKLDALNPDP